MCQPIPSLFSLRISYALHKLEFSGSELIPDVNTPEYGYLMDDIQRLNAALNRIPGNTRQFSLPDFNNLAWVP